MRPLYDIYGFTPFLFASIRGGNRPDARPRKSSRFAYWAFSTSFYFLPFLISRASIYPSHLFPLFAFAFGHSSLVCLLLLVDFMGFRVRFFSPTDLHDIGFSPFSCYYLVGIANCRYILILVDRHLGR